MIVTFIALLELIKLGRLSRVQAENFGEIYRRRPARRKESDRPMPPVNAASRRLKRCCSRPTSRCPRRLLAEALETAPETVSEALLALGADYAARGARRASCARSPAAGCS